MAGESGVDFDAGKAYQAQENEGQQFVSLSCAIPWVNSC